MKQSNKTIFALLFAFLFATVLMATNAFAVWEQNYAAGYRYYTSMKNVSDLNGNVSSITPAIDDNKIPYGDADDYLASGSCLGYYGPLGPYGPLGTLGPIGSNTWNVSYWISAWDWSGWWDDITGPLGPSGPLGENGPVAPDQYYGVVDPGLTLFSTNDFARHSRALGVWSPLGPIGPLGALGALGPLGPIGTHGYSTNANGEYVTTGGAIKRTITMWFNAAQTISRTYELFEKYPETFAKNKTNNDTSFMATGSCANYTEVDSYSFKSASNQVVTIVLVPEYQLDDFDLTITDSSNNVIETSNTGVFIDWVQVKVPANTTIKAKVKLYYSGHALTSTYRLYVTGSTVNLNKTEIQGSHVSNW